MKQGANRHGASGGGAGVKPFYPNLEAEMIKRGIGRGLLQETLDISQKALYNKLTGMSAFTWPEVRKLHRAYFQDIDIATLFQEQSSEDACMETSGVLCAGVEQLSVVNLETGEEIAVITNELITTANDNIVVRLKPVPA